MSLYYVQKLLYRLNRDELTRKRFETDRSGLLSEYELTDEEREAVLKPDIGLLYVLGVNGQILMHYAGMCKFEWDDYLEAMRDGIRKYGPVREGVYTMTGYEGVQSHSEDLRKRRAAPSGKGA
jgi:Aromatic-ring-opening dioxygenase LigAB, LigA subunit